MRRRVRYKVRKRPTKVSISAREFRLGRSYDDFQKILKQHPDLPVVEMDTVIGTKAEGGNTLLTMLFRSCSLMLIFLLEEKSQECVIKVFDWLTEELGIEVFQNLFPIILTDNGTVTVVDYCSRGGGDAGWQNPEIHITDCCRYPVLIFFHFVVHEAVYLSDDEIRLNAI